jgi:hypothetical protein
MYGSYEFVLGRELQEIQVYSMRSGMTRKLEVENKNIMLNQIILHYLIIKLERLQYKLVFILQLFIIV